MSNDQKMNVPTSKQKKLYPTREAAEKIADKLNSDPNSRTNSLASRIARETQLLQSRIDKICNEDQAAYLADNTLRGAIGAILKVTDAIETLIIERTSDYKDHLKYINKKNS